MRRSTKRTAFAFLASLAVVTGLGLPLLLDGPAHVNTAALTSVTWMLLVAAILMWLLVRFGGRGAGPRSE